MRQKFQFLTSSLPTVTALVFLLCVTALCANLLHGVRTFARGEDLWNDSEKQLQISLLQFTCTHDPLLLNDAVKRLAALRADREARIQLESKHPDYQMLRDQYVLAGNNREDLPSGLRVYHLFGRSHLMKVALQAWRDTDPGLFQLEALTAEISAIPPGELSGTRAAEFRNRLMSIDRELTGQTETFAVAMDAASSEAEWVLLIANATSGFVLMFAASFVTRKLRRKVHSSQLRDMALRRANSQLETRVRQRTADLEKEILERKQAQKELQWKTAFMEAQANASSDGILVVDTKGKKIFRNQQFLRIWEIPQAIADEPDDAPQARYAARLTRDPGSFLERVQFLYAHPNEVGRDQVELIDGMVLDRYTGPVMGTDGEHYGRIWTFRNITDRRRQEDALRESTERFRMVVESAPVGIYIHTHGLFRYLNPAALRIFGAASAEQIIGQSIMARIHPDSRDVVAERSQSVVNQRQSVPLLDELYLRLDGTEIATEVSAEPFVFEGRDGAIVFFRDITERKREEANRRLLEQQLRQAQKLESLGRLAGGIAHDFNNLLMCIRAYTEMLQDSFSIGDGMRRHTDQVLKAVERGASLTGQMLAFSRKQIISPSVIDLNVLINETAKMLKRLIGEDVAFKVISDHSLWAIEADSDQIGQILMNLCVNSRDAMPRGGTITISVRNAVVLPGTLIAHPSVPPGEYVSLSVADSGTGISKELQEEIFEPFFTTKEVGKGTGLGLSIVYGIVKQSNGYVWVDSEPGCGTCFTIYFPKATREATQRTAPTPARARGGTETLLVVEDDSLIRAGICEHLKNMGYTVIDAGSGEEALQLASEQEKIDLLITDVVMPRMSGKELSRILHSLRPDMKTLLMSGYTDDAILRQDIHESGRAFLQKPFGLGTLASKVRSLLDQAGGATTME